MLEANKSYMARAIDAGLSATKNNQPQVFIKFEVTHEEGGTDHITWFGNMDAAVKGKQKISSLEQTVKALVTAGFVGNDFPDLEKPFELSFAPKQVSLQLEDHEYNGKTTLRVKFINDPMTGPKKYQGAAPKYGALFSKVRQETGAKPAAVASTENW